MMCPLRLKRQKRGLGTAAFGVPETVEDFDHCLVDECAWWDPRSKDCAVKHPLGNLEEKISLLIDKLSSADSKG